jgi:hypothetical protein
MPSEWGCGEWSEDSQRSDDRFRSWLCVFTQPGSSFGNDDAHPPSVVCLRKQKDQRARFYRIKGWPLQMLLAAWDSGGDVGKSADAGLAPLHPVRPTGPADKTPRQNRPPVALAARRALACKGGEKGPAKDPPFRRCEPTFGPADLTDGNPSARESERTAAVSFPRPRFARSRVLPAFRRALSNRFGRVSD